MDQQDKIYLFLPLVIIIALLTTITCFTLATQEIATTDAPNLKF